MALSTLVLSTPTVSLLVGLDIAVIAMIVVLVGSLVRLVLGERKILEALELDDLVCDRANPAQRVGCLAWLCLSGLAELLYDLCLPTCLELEVVVMLITMRSVTPMPRERVRTCVG